MPAVCDSHQAPGAVRHAAGAHSTLCESLKLHYRKGDIQIWTGVNPAPGSYLATWEHGKDQRMSCHARHIPGPDAPLDSALRGSQRIKVQAPCGSWISFSAHGFHPWRGFFPLSTDGPSTGRGVKSVPYLGWSQRLIPLASAPGGGRATACTYDVEGNITSSLGLIYIVSSAARARVYIKWPHHCAKATHAGFPQPAEKGQSSYGNVKNVLEYPSRPVLSGARLVLPGDEGKGRRRATQSSGGRGCRPRNREERGGNARRAPVIVNLSLRRSEPPQDFTILSDTTWGSQANPSAVRLPAGFSK